MKRESDAVEQFLGVGYLSLPEKASSTCVKVACEEEAQMGFRHRNFDRVVSLCPEHGNELRLILDDGGNNLTYG